MKNGLCNYSHNRESGMNTDSLNSLLVSLEKRRSATVDSDHNCETVLIVSCSMNHNECDLSLWPIEPAWNRIALTTLGNQAWQHDQGETVLDDSFAQLITKSNVDAVLIIGHTACDIIEDAYERYSTQMTELPAGIKTRFEPLVSLVGEAFDTGLIDASMSLRTTRYRLVEYNVIRQVEFLTTVLPEAITVVGYVHDQDGAYNSFPGSQYLVAVDGEIDDTEIQSRVPDYQSVSVANLL